MRVYNGLYFDSEEDKKKLPKIMEKLDELAIGKVNGTYERYMFNSRNQEADESINGYVAALRKLAQTCNIIRDRIVLGVRSKQTRKRLLQERKLTLSKCIDICHEIGNHAVKFQIDCGASINIIRGNSVITPTSKQLVLWNKTKITQMEATRVVLRNPKNQKKYSV